MVYQTLAPIPLAIVSFWLRPESVMYKGEIFDSRQARMTGNHEE